MSIRPIFIFSAPRSGSTLLQRVLGAHSQIATASEPWLLLAPISPLYAGLPAPGARDPLIHAALEDFIGVLPRGRADYRAAVREFALGLYERAAGNIAGADGPAPTYFVDKTPLYHLIVDEIVEVFPDGRFVFLFRNPLSVVASCVELFDDGRWAAPRYHMALFQSFADLVPSLARHADRSLRLRFEDLVGGEEPPWRTLIDYLELPWEPAIIEQFGAVQLRGRMGDPTGARSDGALSREPLDKWRQTIHNPLRRAWCGRYLAWLGQERLAAMGYDLEELRRELLTSGAGTEHLLADAMALSASLVREAAKAHLPRYASRASTWRALLRT
jgi:Sulfotransferase family